MIHFHWLFVPMLLVKGVIMSALILTIANAGFIEAIIVAICSAVVNGIMLLIVGIVLNKTTGQKVADVKEKVEDVQEKVTTENG